MKQAKAVEKLLHLSHTDINSDSRILKEMNGLSRAGYQVYGIGVQAEDGGAKSRVDHSINITSIELTSRKLKFLPRFFRHVVALFELIIKMLPLSNRISPSIVHCHDTTVLPLAVLVKLLTRSKLIYDAHELESNRNGMSKLEGWFTLHVEKLLWPFINALIVVSPSIEKWYSENIGPKPSAVILNSPQYEKNEIAKDGYLRELYAIPKDSLIFIYVGILGPGRGLDLITEVFARSNVTSHLVFLGYGEFANKIAECARTSKNLHYHPAVSHADVVSIVRSADYGLCLVQNVSLSDYYCLPNKLFEYCFAGIPVLASDFPDIRGVVNNHKIGECCELNVESIALAVDRLDRERLSFEFINVQELSWECQEVKLIALYSKLC